MTCPSCQAAVGAGSRFCDQCGARVEAAPGSVAVAPSRLLEPARPGSAPVIFHLHAAHRQYVCPSCGHTATPVPYFSRGLNVIKIIALLPLTFFAPLVFFFWRKDRLICPGCHGILPVTAPLGLLGAFRPDAAGALVALDGGVPLVDPGRRERIATLQHRAGIARYRAWFLGLGSLPFAAMGFAAWPEMAGFAFGAGVSALSGAGALLFAWRAGKNKQMAEAESRDMRAIQILDLARRLGGRLNVTQVASSLGLSLEDAERVLDSIVDHKRVDLDVDDRGRVTYVFPELLEP